MDDPFRFRFTKCDLGHDGSLRASVGKRSPESSTRSPFLAAMGSTWKQGKPNGNQKAGGYRIGQKTIQKAKAHPAEGREAHLLIRERGNLLIIRKGVF